MNTYTYGYGYTPQTVKKVTVKEYDSEGNLVKETITEYTSGYPGYQLTHNLA